MIIKDIRPLYTKLIVTAEKYKKAQKIKGTILDASKLEGKYKEYQRVVRIGSAVREVKEGDLILMDITRYMKRKFSDNSLREDFIDNPIISIDVPTVEMNGVEYFMIEERDIAYVITDSEEEEDDEEDEKVIKDSSNPLYIPQKPSIIV